MKAKSQVWNSWFSRESARLPRPISNLLHNAMTVVLPCGLGEKTQANYYLKLNDTQLEPQAPTHHVHMASRITERPVAEGCSTAPVILVGKMRTHFRSRHRGRSLQVAPVQRMWSFSEECWIKTPGLCRMPAMGRSAEGARAGAGTVQKKEAQKVTSHVVELEIKTFHEFVYLGCVFDNKDDNQPAASCVKPARQKWGMIGRVLS